MTSLAVTSCETEGNNRSTSVSSSKQPPSRKNHFITWFYKNEDLDVIDDILDRCKKKCFKGLIQSEKCPTTGRPHIHFMLWGNKAFRDTELKLPKNSYQGEPLKDVHNTSNYANKEKSHDGIFRTSWGFPKEFEDECFHNTWNEWIINEVQQKPHKRLINWFWSDKGKMGKTALIKYLVAKHNAQFASGGKYTDIMNLIYHTDMDKCRCVIFTLPREHKNHISYSALESVKDGLVSNMKSFKNGSKQFDRPHVFVFANYPPNIETLSKDRWNIIQLDWMEDVKCKGIILS